jgi:hypothetical protein
MYVKIVKRNTPTETQSVNVNFVTMTYVRIANLAPQRRNRKDYAPDAII